MPYIYRLVRERCRVGVDSDGRTRFEIVYALNDRPPSGTRQRLVPALKNALSKQKIKFIALDLFDEYLRLHLLTDSAAQAVEAALDEALQAIEASKAIHPPKEAEDQLRRYLSETSK
jgi:hypothetical protein